MNSGLNQQNKQLVWSYWQVLDNARQADSRSIVSDYLATEHGFHGHDPVGDLTGIEEWSNNYWQPLLRSFPDLRRQSHLFFGGRSSGRVDGGGDGAMWAGGTGYFVATFEQDYLGIPANNAEVKLRWGEFCRVEQQKIVETYLLIDVIDLIRQAGYEVLPPSRGVDGLFPPPQASDGILLEAQNEQTSGRTLEHIRRFVFDALNSYDQSGLESMGIADFFHPDVRWYGPGGIGACLGLEAFEQHHQKHWLHAFPDRQVQDLTALFAEGCYSGGPGWAGVKASHTGRYLDAEATGLPVTFNGLDFWKLEDNRYIENWVFVDMIHLFRQLGIDLFERLEGRVLSENN